MVVGGFWSMRVGGLEWGVCALGWLEEGSEGVGDGFAVFEEYGAGVMADFCK